jgi:DNA-binding transcriptional LysR family regulator
MSDRLNGIAAFVQAAEAGSFALAAERLHLTRSAVGRKIARLEERLGVRLFHRTTRRQSLTEAGRAYYERCVRALAELDAADAALDAGRRAPAGRLRVSVPVLFGRHCAAPVLRKLAQRHPGLRVEVAFSDRVVDLVEEGFDLAVRIGELADSASLAARRLGAQRMGICAAPAYLAARGRPATADELAGHDAIVYARAGEPAPWRLRERDGRLRELRLDGRLRYDDLQAIVDAAVAGAGLAWLPCWLMMPHVRAGELALVMDSERVLATDIHAVWPQSRYLASKTRAAIDALAAEIPPLVAYPLAEPLKHAA